MRMARVALSAFAIMGLLAGSSYAQSMNETIEARNAEFVKAFKEKDAAGFAALYDENAVMFPPDEQKIEGLDNIRKFWQGAIDFGFTDATVTIGDVQESGDWVFENGTYGGKYPDSTGKMVDEAGRYIVIWKKSADGKWRRHWSMWNHGPAKM